jgi:ferredoxin
MPGETILDAAFRTGATWPTICYGQARCTACALLLRDGHEVTVEKKGAKPASGAGRGSPPETRADTESPATESLEEEETA